MRKELTVDDLVKLQPVPCFNCLVQRVPLVQVPKLRDGEICPRCHFLKPAACGIFAADHIAHGNC